MLLGDHVEFAARREGDRPAILFEERAISFAEFHDRVNRLSSALTELAAPGSRIGILSDNRPEYLEAYYGVPMAGMGLTIVNQRLAPREIAYILGDAGVEFLLVADAYLPAIVGVREQLPTLKTVCSIGAVAAPGADLAYEDLLASGRPIRPELPVSEHDLAWLIYTSGTTGRPKGAMLSHRNLDAAATNLLIGVEPERRATYLNPFPLSHASGHMSIAFLDRGITTVLQQGFAPDTFMQAIEQHDVAGAPFAPAMMGMILDRHDLDHVDVSRVRKLFYGASSITPELLRNAMRRFSGARFYQGFGMTELAGNCLFMDDDIHRRGVNGEEHLLAAAGQEAVKASVRIVDEQLRDVPTGSVGELIVKGDQVMLGYWGKPEATRDAVDDGWLRTGDLARMDDERLVSIVDRAKDMILTGGENVYSREVEDVLAEHPDVADVAVVGQPDPVWGESVVAIVVLRDGAVPNPDALIAHCREHLASYKKPRVVHFVAALPRNATGKVLKHELRQRTADPASFTSVA